MISVLRSSKPTFAQNIDKIAELYLKIDVHDVQVKGDQAFIDIRYRTRAKLALPSGSTWTQDSDFSRVNFLKEDGRWMVAFWALRGDPSLSSATCVHQTPIIAATNSGSPMASSARNLVMKCR